MSTAVEQLLKIVRCNNVNVLENTPGLHCGNSQGYFYLSSFDAIEKIVTSSELWPWSTDIFAMAVVIHRVDNNNTTVGDLSTEFSRLLRHFLTLGGVIECKVTGRQPCSPFIQYGSKISCYVTLNGRRNWLHEQETLCRRKQTE